MIRKLLNRKGVTLIETIIYSWILMLFVLLIWRMLQSMTFVNGNTNTSLQGMSSITTTHAYIDKAVSNAEWILLLGHSAVNWSFPTLIQDENKNIDSKYWNQFQWTHSHITWSKCGFINDNDHDLVALITRDKLDPIIIWTIEKPDISGRKYRQLAIYSYRNHSEIELIRGDIALNNITKYLDNKGKYITEWLTDWKCDEKNWFLVPISGRWYIDWESVNDQHVKLGQLKIITPDLKQYEGVTIDDLIRYGTGYLEIHMVWDRVFEQQVKRYYQIYTKTFLN